MVRLAAQELLDSIRFPVGETERAVQRLFRDLAQVIQSNRVGRRSRADETNRPRAALDQA
jgi:hypothetical protein